MSAHAAAMRLPYPIFTAYMAGVARSRAYQWMELARAAKKNGHPYLRRVQFAREAHHDFLKYLRDAHE